MHDEFHKAAVIACRILLVPVIKLLMRYGLSYKEFAEIAKRAFIEVAVGAGDGKISTSHIAVMTGISRKEVSKIASESTNKVMEIQNVALPVRILSIWHSDVSFTDSNGLPKSIPYKSKEGPSLKKLIDQVAIDAPDSSIVRELVRTGAIKEVDGLYRPQFRKIIYKKDSANSIIQVACFIAPLVQTVIHNYNEENIKSQNLRFQRTAFSLRIPERNAKKFKVFMNKQATSFINQMDDELTSLEENPAEGVDNLTGVGVYYFRSRLDPEVHSSLLEKLE